MTTQEEKAKRYDKAIERAKHYYDEGKTLEYANDIVSDIFPELKEPEFNESKDNRIIRVIRGWIYTRPASFFDNGISKEDILDWLERQGEQKSTWSEEDELQMQGIIDLLPGLTIRHNWLKSLKERVQPLPKQEWSEEDSVRLQRIIDFLWYNRKGDTDTIYQQEQDIAWLKSLRPQNNWKPSEEQMATLEYYIYTLLATEHKEVLFGLYNDLKKLKD